MMLGRNAEVYETLMGRSIESWTSDSSYCLEKAIDNATGEMVGWSCWCLKEQEPSDSDLSESNIEEVVFTSDEKAVARTPQSITTATIQPGQTPRQVFSALLGEKTAR